MQGYPTPMYQQYQPPYQDRLAHLRGYQEAMAIQTPQPQQTGQGVIWVQGEAAAKSWMVSPGTTVLLMDSEKPAFYLKSADAAGMPLPLRIFDYAERQQNATPTPDPENKYVTRDEYEELSRKYAEIMDKLTSFSAVDNTQPKRPESRATRNKGGNADE